MIRVYFIYFDPNPKEGYVGITSHPLSIRKKWHTQSSTKSKRGVWIKEKLSMGYRLRIKLLEKNPPDSGAEERWIGELERMGFYLYNSNGGCSSSINARGRKWSKESRDNLSKIKLGVSLSEGHKLSLKLNHRGNRGRKFTKEHRDHLSESLKGRYMPPQTEAVKEKRRGENNKQSLKIKGVNIITGIERVFNSTGEAYRIIREEGVIITRSGIIKAANGQNKTSGGYTWEYRRP